MTALLTAAVFVPDDTSAQIKISGQIDLVGMARSDTLGMNSAFRGDSPYNPVRVRLFASHWVNDRIGIFTEFLYDMDASVRVNGAYVVVNELGGRSWLNTRLGLAPSIVGGFGLRSTYFNSNPLIGVPLVWGWRTNLGSEGTDTAAGLTGVTSEPGGGMPIFYDSCWNIQWEFLGEVGRFEYSLGYTPGSLSNPIKSRFVDGGTWMARVGHQPLPGLRIGLSAAEGPYLSEPVADAGGAPPYPGNAEDFGQGLLGLDVEYQRGSIVLSSEAHAVSYEAPLIEEDLDAFGGFVELRWDFRTAWYLAGRADALLFDEIVTDVATGARAPWDGDTYRTEVTLGYRLAREVLVKADWQRTTVPLTDFSQNLFALQLSAVF